MFDSSNRKIDYLRLSVTDLCNYRCVYCMEKDGVCKKNHSDILSIEELTDICKAAVNCGITKVRLTGGEPLVRKGILTLCENIKKTDGVKELTITTNGSMLKDMAKSLKKAGVDRLNISLDTLNEKRFSMFTRTGNLKDVIEGIDAAIDAGFKNTKINTVLIGNTNTDEIKNIVDLTKDRELTVRFIELMPIGVCTDWDKKHFVFSQTVLDVLPALKKVSEDGVSQLYKLQGYKGYVGLISPMSHSFCHKCNRIRITSDGKLKPCLHSNQEINLKGLCGKALEEAIIKGINSKPICHNLSDNKHNKSIRNMNQIGG